MKREFSSKTVATIAQGIENSRRLNVIQVQINRLRDKAADFVHSRCYMLLIVRTSTYRILVQSRVVLNSLRNYSFQILPTFYNISGRYTDTVRIVCCKATLILRSIRLASVGGKAGCNVATTMARKSFMQAENGFMEIKSCFTTELYIGEKV